MRRGSCNLFPATCDSGRCSCDSGRCSCDSGRCSCDTQRYTPKKVGVQLARVGVLILGKAKPTQPAACSTSTWSASLLDSPAQVGVQKTADIAVQNVAEIGGRVSGAGIFDVAVGVEDVVADGFASEANF